MTRNAEGHATCRQGLLGRVSQRGGATAAVACAPIDGAGAIPSSLFDPEPQRNPDSRRSGNFSAAISHGGQGRWRWPLSCSAFSTREGFLLLGR